MLVLSQPPQLLLQIINTKQSSVSKEFYALRCPLRDSSRVSQNLKTKEKKELNQVEAATGGVLSKSYSLKFCYIPRKAPVLESLFNKITGLKACIFIKKKLKHKCFPVNIEKFLRTPILKNICVLLLL